MDNKSLSPRGHYASFIVCIFLLGAFRLLVIQTQSDEVGKKVYRLILDQSNPFSANYEKFFDELQSIGPESFPYLGELARMRDTFLNTQYKKWLPRLAKPIQELLPTPEDKTRIRRVAMQAIADMGPIVSLECEKAVLEGLWDKDDLTQKYAIRAASWLMHTSSQAKETVLKRYAQHSQLPVQRIGSLDHIEIMWSNSAATGLVLTNLLEDPLLGFEAAMGLGFMSTNAIPAIPYLVKAHSSGNFHQRKLIVKALGQIGRVDQNVANTLIKSWKDEDAMVRKNTAHAVGALGEEMLPYLPELLKNLEDSDNAALGSKLIAIGLMGKGAFEAIPYLLKYCSPDFLKIMGVDQENNIVGQSIIDLSVSAQMSLCRIDRRYFRQYVPQWPERVIGRWGAPVQLLVDAKQDFDLIVTVVEPLLEENKAGTKTTVAAFVILNHRPDHIEANQLLLDQVVHGSMRERIIAAIFLHKAKGEFHHLKQLIIDCLQSEEKYVGQMAMNRVEDLGEEAMPFFETIKEVSWKHNDPSVRFSAGRFILRHGSNSLPSSQIE